MRKIKFLVSLVAILIFCMAMTACAGENKSDQDGQLDAVEVQEGEEQNKVDPVNPDDYNPFRDKDDEGNPVEHATESESHDGQYAYQVGDTTIYTQHDLDQWLVESEKYPGHYNFDIGAMLIDLWCQGNRGGIFENEAGFSYVLDGENTKGVWFDSPDPDNDRMYHAVTVWYKVDGSERTTTVRIYDCPPAPENKDKYYSIMDHYTNIIHIELAPLILYSIEQMEANPSGGALNDLDLGRNFYCD